MNIEPIQKSDLLTGEIFTLKRSTQKFSCTANRIKYNNLKASEFRQELSFINNPLINNYRILEDLLIGKHESVFHIEFLKGKGFDFNVMTHMDKYADQGDFPCIYRYMIFKFKDDQVKIIRND